MQEPNEAAVAAALLALNRGEVIVYPTETLYGLGADALNCAAVDRVFQLKGRQPDSPFPVLVSDETMLREIVCDVCPLAMVLMKSFWPGPLTLVLPARPEIPRPLVSATGGVGVRISSQPLAMKLVKQLRHPLTATSANPSGREPARTLPQAESYFAGRVNIFLDGGTLASKTGSTVTEVQGDRLRIIREGDIGVGALERVVGKEHLSR